MFRLNGKEKDIRTFSKVSIVENKRKYLCLQMPFCSATARFLLSLENGLVEVEDNFIKFSCYGKYYFHANPRNLKCNVWFFFEQCEIENKKNEEFTTDFEGFPCEVIATRKKKTDDGEVEVTLNNDLYGTDIKKFFETSFGYDEKRYYFDFCVQDQGRENLQLRNKDFSYEKSVKKKPKPAKTFEKGLVLGEPLPDCTEHYQYFIIDFDQDKAILKVPVPTDKKDLYKNARIFEYGFLKLYGLNFIREKDFDGQIMGKQGYVYGVTLLQFEGKIEIKVPETIEYDLTPTIDRNKKYREKALQTLGEVCGKFEETAILK